MRVMSFNVLSAGKNEHKWIKRIPLVLKTIIDNSPDILGVQEAHNEWMSALKGGLPEYAYIGVGRDDGKELGEFSAVFYKKDKFELCDSGNFWLSETPEKPSKGWDSACIRICSYAVLTEKETGKKFAHFNTHLDHKGKTAMLKGAELVAKRAGELFPGLPVFLTGDFNVTPNSVPYKAVTDGGFSDTRYIAEKTDTGITFHGFGNEESAVIDYVFIKGDIKVDSFNVIRNKIDGEIPSDHYPVFADLEI